MGRDNENSTDEGPLSETEAVGNSSEVVVIGNPTGKVRYGRAPTKEELSDICHMHSYRRPHSSKSEARWINRFLLPLKGIQRDGAGNWWVAQGESTTLFSAHTDDVESEPGRRGVFHSGGKLQLKKGSPCRCLGADNAAGCWILLELFRAGVPGLYVWHRNEESGRVGSKAFASLHRDTLLQGITKAVAFDRRYDMSVITHQMGDRCCSKAFGNALIEELGQGFAEGKHWKLDDGGSFTDTASYVGIVPECTNISVGFSNEHSRHEELDLYHLCGLRDAVIQTRWEQLPVERNPKVVESKWGGHYTKNYAGPYYNRGQSYHTGQSSRMAIPGMDDESWRECAARAVERVHGRRVQRIGFTPGNDTDGPRLEALSPWEREVQLYPLDRCTTVAQIVHEYPDTIADILEEWGYDVHGLAQEVLDRFGKG